MSGEPSVAESEVIERASTYINRADTLRSNFDDAVVKEEYDKATEMLWGIFSCYVDALALLRIGKAYTEHKSMIDFAQQIAKKRGTLRLSKSIKHADQAHANFYHGFVKDKEELKVLYKDVYYAIRVFKEEVKAVLTRLKPP